MWSKVAICVALVTQYKTGEGIVLDITQQSRLDSSQFSRQQLGGMSRACNMLIQAERLYEQDPSHQHEVLLKTARRLLNSLQAEFQKRA